MPLVAMATNYLYGDSSPAPLTVNYIELLRDSLTFAVEHLLAEQQRHGHGKKGLGLRGACDAEVRRIEELARIVARTMEGAPVGDKASIAGQCAQGIIRAAEDQTKLAIEAARAQLATDLGRLAEQEAVERVRSFKALEQLLLAHDLPDTTYSLQLVQSGGAKYVGRVSTTAGLGLDAMLEIEILPGSTIALAPILRIEKLAPALELQTPESGGWLRKETRMKPMRVDKLCLIDLAIGDGGAFKLRTNPDGTGAGFDVTIGADKRSKLVHHNEKGEALAYDAAGDDVKKIADLYERLVEAANEARFARKRLVDATLDGEKFIEHDEPTVLIERLVEEMAPVVQEIARRSKSTEELIIKRVTGDKRREEIFISKAELVAKIALLPTQLRNLFTALGLEEQRPSTRPPPAPKTPSRRAPPIPDPPPLSVALHAAPPSILVSDASSVSEIEVSSGDWEVARARAKSSAPPPAPSAELPTAKGEIETGSTTPTTK
ncbi:MAG: hypothetical protein ACHREM_12530 [Polyangiales bacterium]